jgi:hypothetical protein
MKAMRRIAYLALTLRWALLFTKRVDQRNASVAMKCQLKIAAWSRSIWGWCKRSLNVLELDIVLFLIIVYRVTILLSFNKWYVFEVTI